MINVKSFMTVLVVACTSAALGCASETATQDSPSNHDSLETNTEAAAVNTAEAQGDEATADSWCNVSFASTCQNPYWERDEFGAVTYASASSCADRAGRWGIRREWRGYCTSDLMNDNGNLRCR